MLIYEAVQFIDSKMETFHCRKNKFGGEEIDNVFLHQSYHLCLLNLSGNKLSESNSKLLFEYAHDNSFIEELNISGNILVSAQIMNDITQECRKNILIKKTIMTELPLA